jgi:hypothetical protein
VAEGPEGPEGPKKAKKRRAKHSRNQPTSFDIEAELRRSFGVDLTQIDGIKAMTAQGCRARPKTCAHCIKMKN